MKFSITVIDKFTPKERESDLKGYFKTYRIDGVKGYDPKNFLSNIKQKVINLGLGLDKREGSNKVIN